MKPTFGMSAVAMAVAGAVTAAHAPQAEANVVNFSWRGAFTILNSTGAPITNDVSDYMFAGFYPNGGPGYGAPYFPDNVAPGTDCTTYAPACVTASGWYGKRTPISGMLSFDTSTGAGVGTINPFFFLGETPGSGPGTHVAHFLNPTFQIVDTMGTIVGSMMLSWNGGGHSMSIVLDGSGLLGSLSAMFTGGYTSTASGVGALPATENTNFGTVKSPIFLPLGPVPIATKTLNTGAGCDGLNLATQVNAWTITTNMANVATCTTGVSDDGIGGDPMTSFAFDWNANFDIMSVHLETHGDPPAVPIPATIWLFGSGLLGLIGLARRKKST